MNYSYLILIITFNLIFSTLSLCAQQNLEPIPIDKQVRYGVLDNGLTYYIRHNELPQSRAEFFIAQRVGSVLEEDNQLGLAHFLEHMAFNGTKNYPGKTLINYLETIGVKFGENLNAYTSFDATVYNISNVPVSKEGVIDSCLLILHDWSGFISLEEEEIEKERGVIREEMRTRNHAGYRQIEKLLPIIMPESRYANRMPIGTEEVIMNFKPEELRAYYQKWYRPDLQGIIIIGDIDVNQVEEKVKTLFSNIPKPTNPAERIYYPVPDNEEPIVGIAQDKENTQTIISINYKHESMPAELYASSAGLVMNYIKAVISEMLDVRFSEIKEKVNPPFIQAGARGGKFVVAKTKDAWEFYAIAKDDGVEEALKCIAGEIQRAKLFGFTESEYHRARISVLKGYENAYNERGKRKNNSYAQEYVDHFLNGGYIPGIEYEYTKVQEVASYITVEYLNKYFNQATGEQNIVMFLIGPEKRGVQHHSPDEEQLLSWRAMAQNDEELEAYEDDIKKGPLMLVLPQKGKITEVYKDSVFGTTQYTLSNGARVIIKPTTFKDDEIQMRATSEGGSSLFPETELASIKTYRQFSNIGGLGDFSPIDLKKMLVGKKVDVQPSMTITHEKMTGQTSPNDFETMLQLVHLHFVNPKIDAEAFQSQAERLRAQLISKEADPYVTLIDSLHVGLFQQPARISRLKAEHVDSAKYQTIMNWRKDRYKDASDFTFLFVGNINPEEAEGLITQYIGSLPSTYRRERYQKVNVDFKKGKTYCSFYKAMENPKTTIVNMHTGQLLPTLANQIKMDMLQQILRIVYTEKVREDEGGTYGVSVEGEILNYPKGQASLQIWFDTNSTKRFTLKKVVEREWIGITSQGPRPDDFNKVKEFMLKKQAENEQENSYWVRVLENRVEHNYDMYTNYVKTLQGITMKDIQDFAAQLHNQGNLLEIIMIGTKK